MKKLEKAPTLKGVGEVNNLIPNGAGEGIDSCPCCGATWKGGKPWSGTTITPRELATALGISDQAVYHRIRTGKIAAYLRPTLGRDSYLIPIFEAKRVLEEQGQSCEVEDLGADHD